MHAYSLFIVNWGFCEGTNTEAVITGQGWAWAITSVFVKECDQRVAIAIKTSGPSDLLQKSMLQMQTLSQNKTEQMITHRHPPLITTGHESSSAATNTTILGPQWVRDGVRYTYVVTIPRNSAECAFTVPHIQSILDERMNVAAWTNHGYAQLRDWPNLLIYGSAFTW